MSKTKPNDFIAVHYYHENGSMPEAKNIYTQEKLIPKGLTKREHFTSMAIQGLLSNPIFIENYRGKKDLWEAIADEGVAIADKTINALNKETK